MPKKTNKKILICDDDLGILEVMKIILEEEGFKVKTLESAKGIIKKISEFKPDLLFLDIWMPGMEGRETVKLLKRDSTTSSLPIVIISALNDTKKIAESTGANGFLAKPFTMRDLITIARKYTH